MPDALIIVDYQNDFARPDGALSVPAGEEVADHINALARSGDYETVVGLATDYCVKNTALDALREGFAVRVDRAGIRGVDVQPGDSERALEELAAAGATVA